MGPRCWLTHEQLLRTSGAGYSVEFDLLEASIFRIVVATNPRERGEPRSANYPQTRELLLADPVQ